MLFFIATERKIPPCPHTHIHIIYDHMPFTIQFPKAHTLQCYAILLHTSIHTNKLINSRNGHYTAVRAVLDLWSNLYVSDIVWGNKNYRSTIGRHKRFT